MKPRTFSFQNKNRILYIALLILVRPPARLRFSAVHADIPELATTEAALGSMVSEKHSKRQILGTAYSTCTAVTTLLLVPGQRAWTSPRVPLCAAATHPGGCCCAQAQEPSAAFMLRLWAKPFFCREHMSSLLDCLQWKVLNKYWIIRCDLFIYLINKEWAGCKSKRRNIAEAVARSQCSQQVRVFGRHVVL